MGIDNIYLANQVGSKEGLERISLLAKKVKTLRVAVDDPTYVNNLAAAVGKWEIMTPVEVLVELNINHNRCGVNSVDDAVKLALQINNIETSKGSLKLAGITGYEGHTPVLAPADKTRETAASHKILSRAKAAIEAAGIPVHVISGGGSCNYIDCLTQGVLTELQAGGGVICDLLYYHKANLGDHGHKMGAGVLTQIVSVAADQSRAIADAGFKSAGWHPFGGFPEPRDRKDIKVIGLSAEHIKLVPTQENSQVKLAWGDKLVLIPGYTDATGFLHKKIYGIRNDIVEEAWNLV